MKRNSIGFSARKESDVPTFRLAIGWYIDSFKNKRDICFGDPIFTSRNRDKYGNLKPLDLSTYWRLYQGLKDNLQLDFPIGTHTPRRTFGYLHYKNSPTEETLSFLSRKFNHSSVSVTKLYIGSQQEEDDDRILSLNL